MFLYPAPECIYIYIYLYLLYLNITLAVPYNPRGPSRRGNRSWHSKGNAGPGNRAQLRFPFREGGIVWSRECINNSLSLSLYIYMHRLHQGVSFKNHGFKNISRPPRVGGDRRFPGPGGSGGPGDCSERWGAKPHISWIGFPGPLSRLGPRSPRFPTDRH